MLKLCGFAASNYYNKVKLALLEKEISFEECLVSPTQSNAMLAKSPLGKVPYVETSEGVLVESQVLLEYLEGRFPHPALLPELPFARARVRELITFLDLHLELVARELYPAAFFGGHVACEVKTRCFFLLSHHVKGFRQRAVFASPISPANNSRSPIAQQSFTCS